MQGCFFFFCHRPQIHPKDCKTRSVSSPGQLLCGAGGVWGIGHQREVEKRRCGYVLRWWQGLISSTGDEPKLMANCNYQDNLFVVFFGL